MFCAGSKQIDDIQMFSQVDHHFQFAYKSLESCNFIHLSTNHFDCYGRNRFLFINSNRFRLDNATECTRSKFSTLIQTNKSQLLFSNLIFKKCVYQIEVDF